MLWYAIICYVTLILYVFRGRLLLSIRALAALCGWFFRYIGSRPLRRPTPATQVFGDMCFLPCASIIITIGVIFIIIPPSKWIGFLDWFLIIFILFPFLTRGLLFFVLFFACFFSLSLLVFSLTSFFFWSPEESSEATLGGSACPAWTLVPHRVDELTSFFRKT